MKARPSFRPREMAPVEDVYIAVDRSGEVLSTAVLCKQGQELPALLIAEADMIGYIRIGEVEATATTA